MSSSRAGIAVLSLATVAIVVGACAIEAPGPSGLVVGSTSPTLTPSSAPSTPPSSALPTETPSPVATPTVYAEYHKLAEGPHDGFQPIALPARVAVDYRVSGTCTFEIIIATMASETGFPRLSLRLTGGEQSGTWTFAIAPGSYLIYPSEAVGCTFDVVARDPG